MITMTSTAGWTRPEAVATPLRAGATDVTALSAGVRVVTGLEPFGSALPPHSAVVDGRSAYAPKTDAQLRASVRPRPDL